jgi:hypothetical protein
VRKATREKGFTQNVHTKILNYCWRPKLFQKIMELSHFWYTHPKLQTYSENSGEDTRKLLFSFNICAF